MKATNKLIVIAGLVAVLNACGTTAANYRPIVDGELEHQYETDLLACSDLAEQRKYINDDVKSEALAGAVVGAVIGAVEDGEGVEGAVAGAVVGGTGRAWETREERKQIVISCMKQRGHKVVG